jgi:hypothetical protein
MNEQGDCEQSRDKKGSKKARRWRRANRRLLKCQGTNRGICNPKWELIFSGHQLFFRGLCTVLQSLATLKAMNENAARLDATRRSGNQ